MGTTKAVPVFDWGSCHTTASGQATSLIAGRWDARLELHDLIPIFGEGAYKGLELLSLQLHVTAWQAHWWVHYIC